MSEPAARNASSERAQDENDANPRPLQQRRVNVGSGGEGGGGSIQGRSSQQDSRQHVSTSDVQQFKDKCLAKLQGPIQSPPLEELEPRVKLLKLLCRKPSGTHKVLQRNLPANLLDSEPHDSNNDDGKLAKQANQIRLEEHHGGLTDEAIQILKEIPGWTDPSQDKEPWGIGDMCFCKTCNKSTFDRESGLYRALYTERLHRKLPWYTDENEKELRDLIKKHWKAFFSKIQQWPLEKYDAGGSHPMLRRDGHRVSMREVYQLFDDANAKQELWDDANERLKRDAYAAIALMNQYRRDQYDHQINSLSGLEPAFSVDIRLNFEGTEDDHYCLGSRPTGYKYYVGVTNDEIRRHAQHAGLQLDGEHDKDNEGAYFIRFMTGRCAKKPDTFGGWNLDEKRRLDGKSRAFMVDIRDGPWSTEDEDLRVIKLCNHQGLHHVRGGVHVFPKLSEMEMAQLRSYYRARYNLCSNCGAKGHWASKCPKCGQPANEDPALLAHMNLLVGSDKDERIGIDDPFERAGIVAAAVCESLPVGRIVCMSNSAEIDTEPATGKLGKLVDALYGDGASRSLRPLQTQAMQYVIDDDRPDITLTVPTAYGKTRVYTVAAVHEVIHGAGRAVIFLPYSALMSDIACEFAKLCDGEHDEVVKYQADDRVRGTEMPYGGILHVDLKDDNDQNKKKIKKKIRHSITWTIWRGFSGDEHMRMHRNHRVFRNAQIILATPDKWAYPDPGKNNDGKPRLCDSFIRSWGHDADSRKKWISELGLVVIDEAHEFKEVLGGHTRELLRRMRTLRDIIKDEKNCTQRVMLVSATIPEPGEFSKKLLGKPENSHEAILVGASAGGGAAEFLFEPSKTGTNNKSPLDYKDMSPEDRVDASDARALVDKLRPQTEFRHRILLLLPFVIKPHLVRDEILSPDVLGVGLDNRKALVRRVLIFLDSKGTSAQLVRLLKSRDFANEWKKKNVEVTVTPYHGDVARMHRRVYEGKMKDFVKEPDPSESSPTQYLHIIVATSALEAGVNVRGIDVIIILDASRCSRESLLQRIGRAGRVAGTPAVCIIGSMESGDAAPTAPDEPDVDEETSEGPSDDDDEAAAYADTTTQPDLMRDPEAYLRPKETAVALANSRAMKLHSARQLMRDMEELKCSEKDIPKVQEAINTTIGSPPNAPVNWDALTKELDKEITARDADPPDSDGYLSTAMSMRGSNSGAVSIRLSNRVTETAGDVQIRGVARRRGRGKTFVELARIDALKCFEQAHWYAHYQDPHGQLYRVCDFRFRRGGIVDARNGRWLQRLEAANVVKLLPGDTNPGLKTKGDTAECCELVHVLGGAPPPGMPRSLRIGTVRKTIKWNGFSYINPYNGHEVGEYQSARHPKEWTPPFDELHPDNQIFFQPAKFRFSGWEWKIQQPLPTDLKDAFAGKNREEAKRVSKELTLHICEKLGCGRQDLSLSFVTADHAEECACEGKVKIAEDGEGEDKARLLVYESSATGLAKECLNVIAQVLSRHKGMDKDVHDCVKWLDRQWRAESST